MEGRRVFAVDEWNNPCALAFFLTHLHSDHTRGLSAQWRRGPLFCSPITASLLLAKFPGFDQSCLHPLPVGSPSLLPLTGKRGGLSRVLLEVTPIDADHCPGSVMYVFRGEFGCVLHTGDFRWEVETSRWEDLQRRKCQLLAAIGGARVDRLYLDNTFCNVRFSFPPRHVAAKQVVEIIASHSEYDVVIGVDNLGKEELLLHIARSFKTKVWVWPERLQTVRLLGLPDVFTTDTTMTRIRAVPRYSISKDTLCMLNKLHPTIAVLPTGCHCLCKPSTSRSQFEGLMDLGCSMCYTNTCASSKIESEIKIDAIMSGMTRNSVLEETGIDDCLGSDCFVRVLAGTIYMVSYSLHSCYSELQAFVELIRPNAIVGNLLSCANDINPAHHFDHLCGKGGILFNEVASGLKESCVVTRDNSLENLGILKSLESSDFAFIPVEKIPEVGVHHSKELNMKPIKRVIVKSVHAFKMHRRKRKRCHGVLISSCSSGDETTTATCS